MWVGSRSAHSSWICYPIYDKKECVCSEFGICFFFFCELIWNLLNRIFEILYSTLIILIGIRFCISTKFIVFVWLICGISEKSLFAWFYFRWSVVWNDWLLFKYACFNWTFIVEGLMGFPWNWNSCENLRILNSHLRYR